MGDLKNKNNNSGSGSTGKWSASYRDKMSDEIRRYANKHFGSGKDNSVFVNCVIGQLEAKFPNENVDPQNSEAQNILNSCENGSSGN